MSFDTKREKEMRKKFGPRKNQYIKVQEVQLIDDKGENLGVVQTQKALALAEEKGLDLVEVGATVQPPVCKIMDFAKYMYLQEKKAKSSKKGKAKDTKEFRFTAVIDKGDIEHRVKRAKEYLSKGFPVKITMFRKGRIPKEQASEVFDSILTNFTDYSSIEPEPVNEGRYIFLTFKPDGKTKDKQNSKKEGEDV